MKVKVEFYKPSGKWYASDTIELPDSTELWDTDLYDIISKTQKCIYTQACADKLCAVDISEEEAIRLGGKFFKAILNARNIIK